MFSDLAQMVTYIQDNQDRFLELLYEHVQLTVISVLIAILIAVPLAVVASRFDLLAKPLTWLAAALGSYRRSSR